MALHTAAADEIKKLREENGRLTQELAGLRQERDDFDIDSRRIAEENARLRSELHEQTEAKDAAYQKLYALKEENARLKERLAVVESALNALR